MTQPSKTSPSSIHHKFPAQKTAILHRRRRSIIGSNLSPNIPMDALRNTHVKLLAFDFLSLTQQPADPNTFRRKSTLLLTRAETVGVVVTRELKPDRFLKFTVDDGTGCIPCILWLNQLNSNYFSRRNPSDVRLIAQVSSRFASQIQLGVVARVRGRISGYRGSVQITVSDVVVERDPNVEIFHWVQCIELARKCYDVVHLPNRS